MLSNRNVQINSKNIVCARCEYMQKNGNERDWFEHAHTQYS